MVGWLPISVSPPFNFPLLCLSIAHAYNLSFLILQSHHFILYLLFSKYFFLTTIPDEGLSPKRRIIKIFSLNLHHLDHVLRIRQEKFTNFGSIRRNIETEIYSLVYYASFRTFNGGIVRRIYSQALLNFRLTEYISQEMQSNK